MQNELDAKRIRATLKGMRPEEKPSKMERAARSIRDAFGTSAPEAPPAAEPADEMPASLRAIITDRLNKIKARAQGSE